MLDLASVKAIVGALRWISTLGKSDVKDVQKEVDELIAELSKSLTSLWDLTKSITAIPEEQFSKKRFVEVQDYFTTFYAGDHNISAARTRCGNVERSVGRIIFKLTHFLHTDVGKWGEAWTQLREIVHTDGQILEDYDKSVAKIHKRLGAIRADLDARKKKAPRDSYYKLKDDLREDVEQLRKGVEQMEKALGRVRRVSG
jgi:hypothetical protein